MLSNHASSDAVQDCKYVFMKDSEDGKKPVPRTEGEMESYMDVLWHEYSRMGVKIRGPCMCFQVNQKYSVFICTYLPQHHLLDAKQQKLWMH